MTYLLRLPRALILVALVMVHGLAVLLVTMGHVAWYALTCPSSSEAMQRVAQNLGERPA